MIQSVVSPTVVCRQLTKSYNSAAGSVRVVRGIDLSVAPQTLTMLVGPSGCGKTTLLSLVAGILEPTFGSVSVLEKRLDRLTDRQRTLFRRQFIGLVVQENNLLPTLTAAENVAVTLAIAGWSKRLALEKAYEILDRFDLSSHRNSLPRELSGGQQQRVAIARAVVHEPQVLICDEPTSALDHQTGQTILKLLKRIARDPGRSVLMVTHDTRTFSFADRILHMHDGRIQEDQ